MVHLGLNLRLGGVLADAHTEDVYKRQVLMYFEMPLPFMPPFLKVDPSAIPILIGSFILGPAAGVAMAFIKAFVHLFSSGTGGVGELADFIITSSFAVSASLVYRRHHTKKGAILACAVGTDVYKRQKPHRFVRNLQC